MTSISSMPTFSPAHFHGNLISTSGIRVFFGLTILHRAACSLTVWHTACCIVHYMVELLEAVAVQQVREKCTCMSMSNNSPTLV